MFPNTHKGAMTQPLVYMKNPALRGICFAKTNYSKTAMPLLRIAGLGRFRLL